MHLGSELAPLLLAPRALLQHSPLSLSLLLWKQVLASSTSWTSALLLAQLEFSAVSTISTRPVPLYSSATHAVEIDNMSRCPSGPLCCMSVVQCRRKCERSTLHLSLCPRARSSVSESPIRVTTCLSAPPVRTLCLKLDMLSIL